MTPGARLQAIVELLEAFEQSPQAPLDQFLALYFKKRRYIGSKDRVFIANTTYRLFRYWGHIQAISVLMGVVLEQVSAQQRARMQLLIFLIYAEGASHMQVASWFNGQKHHPTPLTSQEKVLFQQKVDVNALPLWAQWEIPADLLQPFQNALPHQTQAHAMALLGEAPVDVRANLLKTTPENLQQLLEKQGIATCPTPMSPWGLRLMQRQPLTNLKAFQEGLFEVQDEGSQLVALLTGVKPGDKVVDFCAGAGGKTLALSGAMRGKGKIWACDIAPWRLQRARQRLRRADVQNVVVHPLVQPHDPWVQEQRGKMDRVLVDAPCTGSGVWRRQPEKKWRLSVKDLVRLQQEQASILDQACTLVKVGGELCYVTCSVFGEENRHQVTAFLKHHPEFEPIPMAKRWEDVLPGRQAPQFTQDCLQLTPLFHQTDGFFMALFRRVAVDPS